MRIYTEMECDIGCEDGFFFANITMKKQKVVIIQMFVMFIKKIKRNIGGRNNRE